MRFLFLVLSLCCSMSPLLAKQSSLQQEGETCFAKTSRYSRRSFSGLFSQIKRYGSFSTQKTYSASSENVSPADAPALRKKEATKTSAPSQSLKERFRRSSFSLSSFSFKKKRPPSQSSEQSVDSGFESLGSTSERNDSDFRSSGSINSLSQPADDELTPYATCTLESLNDMEELLQALAEKPNQEPPQVLPNGHGGYVTRSGHLCTQHGDILAEPLFFDDSQQTWDSPEACKLWAQEQKEQKHCPHDETDHHAFPSVLSATELQPEAKSLLLEESGYLVPNALDLNPKSMDHTIEMEDGYLVPNISSPQGHTSNLEAKDHPHSLDASLQRLRDELLDLMNA